MKYKMIISLAMAMLILCMCGCGGIQEASAQPSPTQPATVRVTFPEGLTVMQMSQLLESNGVCSASDFCNTMNTVDFSGQYPFLPEFSELSDRVYYLEGYLFPDTYDFYVGESAESVIKRFLNNFSNRISEEMIQSAAAVGGFYNTELSFDDIIIMASIIEREISGITNEMPGVAAVFYNRIKYPQGTADGSATGGYFQSDATKFYPYVRATAPSGFVSEYNTFNVKGLPKGPICNPSMSSIIGALNPDHSQDAFFFYTDVNGKVYYAVTFSQHQKNWKYCVENGLEPA